MDEAGPSLRGARIVVVGAGGRVGSQLVVRSRDLGAVVTGVGRRPGATVDALADTTDADQIGEAVERLSPTLVIDVAAMTDVDACQRDPGRAHAVNAIGAGNVARASATVGARLVHVGTDWVFGDRPGAPFAEDDPTGPVNHYGASKLAGERAVRAAHSDAVIARTAWVFGGVGKHFPETILRILAQRPTMEVVADVWGNPTYVGDLVEALVAVAASDVSARTLHLVNAGATSRYELAVETARRAGLDPARVLPTTSDAFHAAYPEVSPRPRDTRLSTVETASLEFALPDWQSGLAAWFGTDDAAAYTERTNA